MTGIAPYILIIVLIAFSAFFSGSEIAYSSANRLRMRHRAENGGKLHKLAYKIYESFDTALITILVGNNLVNIASSSVATVIAIQLLGDSGAWAATAVMTVLILTFGEIIPKILAKRTAESFTAFAAVPLRVVMLIFYPFVLIVRLIVGKAAMLWERGEDDGPSVTEEELETIIETAEDEGVIDEEQSDLLQNALDFGDVLAYEIITPRVDTVAIEIDDVDYQWDEVLTTLMDASYSRIPVYEDTIDNIIGVLHLNKLLTSLTDGVHITSDVMREMLMPVLFVHKTMPLNDVLSAMKKAKRHMVVVTDEYGGTMGILTMEDVLEQLVGDIWDENDDIVTEFEQIGDDMYEADGDMRTEDLFDELELDYDELEDDNATLGGWATDMLGHYPEDGNSFEYKNLIVTVKAHADKRVTRLTIRVLPVEENDEDEF